MTTSVPIGEWWSNWASLRDSMDRLFLYGKSIIIVLRIISGVTKFVCRWRFKNVYNRNTIRLNIDARLCAMMFSNTYVYWNLCQFGHFDIPHSTHIYIYIYRRVSRDHLWRRSRCPSHNMSRVFFQGYRGTIACGMGKSEAMPIYWMIFTNRVLKIIWTNQNIAVFVVSWYN